MAWAPSTVNPRQIKELRLHVEDPLRGLP
jgi:hypothetical protein